MEDTGFKRKKVEAMTLGEKIGKLRSEYRMSFTEVSRATKIPIKYLEYLERAEYEKLPADVYVRGYLRSYARHLGLPDDALIKLYEKEQHINKNLGRERTVSGIRPRVPLEGAGFVVTSKEVIITLSVLVLFVIGVYLYREFRAFVSDPYLIVTEPTNEAVISAPELSLSGKADARAVVSVNDTLVPVAGDGSFHENLILHTGQNTIIIVAKNRFDKEKRIVLSVTANIASGVVSTSDEIPMNAIQKEKTFPVELSVRGESTKVTVEVDGSLVYSGLLEERIPRQFDGVQRVKVRSENGALTFVRVGGNQAEALSSIPGLAEKEFLAPNL
ncbi:MAG: helix-turn-helix domain-containing protein [Candidatus Moraniibacteriota bacterium]